MGLGLLVDNSQSVGYGTTGGTGSRDQEGQLGMGNYQIIRNAPATAEPS